MVGSGTWAVVGVQVGPARVVSGDLDPKLQIEVYRYQLANGTYMYSSQYRYTYTVLEIDIY